VWWPSLTRLLPPGACAFLVLPSSPLVSPTISSAFSAWPHRQTCYRALVSGTGPAGAMHLHDTTDRWQVGGRTMILCHILPNSSQPPHSGIYSAAWQGREEWTMPEIADRLMRSWKLLCVVFILCHIFVLFWLLPLLNARICEAGTAPLHDCMHEHVLLDILHSLWPIVREAQTYAVPSSWRFMEIIHM
jgi:hypothetical protein